MSLNLLGSSCSSGGGKRIKGRKGRKSRMSGKKRKSGTFKKSRGRSFKLSRGKKRTRKGRRRRRTRRGGGPKNILKKSRDYLSRKLYGGSSSPAPEQVSPEITHQQVSPSPASEFLTKDSLIKLITHAEPFGIGMETEDYRTFAVNKQKFLDNIDEIFVKFKELPHPTQSINVETGGEINDIWIQYDIRNNRRQQFSIDNINGEIITNNTIVGSEWRPGE